MLSLRYKQHSLNKTTVLQSGRTAAHSVSYWPAHRPALPVHLQHVLQPLYSRSYGSCSLPTCSRLYATPLLTVAVDKETLRDQLLNFKVEVETPDGMLTISVLQRHWLNRTADVLTEAFADAKGLAMYRLYLRHQIVKYLEQHIAMPPRAVVLTAVFTPDSCIPSPAPPSGAAMSGGSSSIGRMGEIAPSLSAEHALSALSGMLQVDCSASHADEAGSKHAVDDAGITSNSGNSSKDSVHPGSNSGAGSGSPSSSSLHSSTQFSLSGHSTGDVPLPPTAPAAPAPPAGQILVGVAEVSLDSSTRTQYVMLNAPERCAYLCNMAVDPEFRRRGIALHLIAAAESLAVMAGQKEMYLHLRFQDEPAGALYRTAGFTVHKEDPWLVRLMGLDRRYLLVKQLDQRGHAYSTLAKRPIRTVQPVPVECNHLYG